MFSSEKKSKHFFFLLIHDSDENTMKHETKKIVAFQFDIDIVDLGEIFCY